MSTEILKVAAQYSVYSGCTTVVFGIIGNLLNILVFTQLRLFRDNRCAFYLTVESISSFLFQCVNFSLSILTSIYGDDATGRSHVWCKSRYILSQTLLLTNYCMICSAAVDQFFSTNYRFNLRQMCTLKLTRCLTFAFVCLWIVHSIVFGSFFDIQPSLGCVISNPVCLRYATYFVYSVLAGLLPIAIASMFSILAFRNVRRIVRRQLPIVRRRLDQQITAMVLIRVLVFVCSVSPYIIYRIYIINFPIPQSQPTEYAIGRLIQAIFYSFVSLNYTASFYAYLKFSSRFRRQLKLILIKKYRQRRKFWCCFKQNQINPANANTFGTTMELEEYT